MRYIDADKFIAELEREKTVALEFEDGVAVYEIEHTMNLIGMQPTADVVPKSEVDELIGKFECFLCHVTGSRLSKHTYDLGTMESVATDCINETYNDGYDEGYKDCAREICEELARKSTYVFPTMLYTIAKRDVDELKNKYTEDKE